MKLEVEYGETSSYKMNVAASYAMLPKDLQERVWGKCAVSWDTANESDAALILWNIKEEGKNIAKPRRDMINPKSMDIDEVWAEYVEEEGPLGEVNYVWKSGDKGEGKGNRRVLFAWCSRAQSGGASEQGQRKSHEREGRRRQERVTPAEHEPEQRVDSESLLWVWMLRSTSGTASRQWLRKRRKRT